MSSAADTQTSTVSTEAPVIIGAPSLDIVRAAVGGVFCLAFAVLKQPHPLDSAWGEAILLLCPLCLIPLTLVVMRMSAPVAAIGTWKLIEQFELSAATVLIGAFLMPPTLQTAVLTLPWLAVTALVGWAGVLGLTRRIHRDLSTLMIDVGCMFLAMGGVWTFLDRSGIRLWGFDQVIALLTAVHFHYAGFLLLVVTGWAARELEPSKTAGITCVAVVIGVPLTALGILAAHFKWDARWEAFAATFMAVSGWLVAYQHLRLATGRTDAARPVRALWTICSAALFFSMALAVLYALRSFVQIPVLNISNMRAIHGSLNAVGFGLCGVAAWRWHRTGLVRGAGE